MIFRLYCRLYQGVLRCVSPLLPWREPHLLEGTGSTLRLPETLWERGIRRVLLVTDAHLYSLGLPAPLIEALANRGIETTVFSGAEPNPTVTNVEDALKLYLANRCEGIIGFGGGSAIDCSKGVGIRVARPNRPLGAFRGILKVRRTLPLVAAVPTTAGTGSEVTLATVISDHESRDKYAIMDVPLIPAIAVLDAELTRNLPPAITAATGMDALTHAVEACIGRSNNRQTANDAITATQLILKHLPRVWNDPADMEGREAMLRAAYLAGRSFTRAYVGNVHAVAHTLGAFYGVPHGLANAIILPHMLELYGEWGARRLNLLARHAGLADGTALIARIRELNRQLDIPEYVPEIRQEDIPLMAERAFREANPLYPVPRILTRQDFADFYRMLSGSS